MRILQVRFKNLNSLVGEWEIDLTHSAFSSDGIFAIIGPTGAGKTTILDAICLALYGRTPRLNKVTKSSNEIMSRQTGECFSEVTFETQVGRYRCHWGQRRARKKPDGELQSPRHEIADANSGHIFEAKIRGVAEQIEAVTGMDFDRFTRSMLLAQGGFAAFLQAAPDERAPILEQITGTEIYSQISIRVHERRADERKKLDALLAEFDGMQLLNEEDERQLSTNLEQKAQHDADLSKQIIQRNQATIWIDNITKLEQELKLVEERKKDWQTRQAMFAPEHEKLQRANQALELAGDHTGLTSVRREQETDRCNHNECMVMHPNREEEVKNAIKTMQLAEEKLNKKKSEQKEASVTIKKIREIDLKLREKDSTIKAACEQTTEIDKSLNTLKSKQNEDIVTLGNKKKAIEELVKYLIETKVDEDLVEHLAGIRGRFDTLKNLHEQQNVKMEAVKTSLYQVKLTTQIWNEQVKNLENQKVGLNNNQSVFIQKDLELKNILEGQDLLGWRRSLLTLTERKTFLDKICEAVLVHSKSKRLLDELDKNYDGLVVKKSNLSEEIEKHGEKNNFLEREMLLLETQLSLLKKIQNFTEARHQLQDNEPCPLCGSKEHPFAEGNIPAPDETISKLGKVRADLKTASDAVTNLRVKQAEVQKDLEQIVLNKKECSEKITESKTFIDKSCATISIDCASHDLYEILQHRQNENTEKLDSVARIVRYAEAMEKEIVTLRESLEKAKELVVQAERETQNAAHKKESMEQQLERENKEAATIGEQIQELLGRVQQEVSVYRLEPLSIGGLDHILVTLTARRDLWVARQKKRAELDQQIIALDTQTSHQAEQITKTDSDLKNQQEIVIILRGDREVLSLERHETFSDKNPDDEELRLSHAVDEAEKGLDASRQVLIKANQELEKLKQRIGELDKSMSTRAIQLKTAEEKFLYQLSRFEFSDEASYMAACLPENQRNILMQQAHKLNNENTELSSLERDKTAKLETERQKQITNQTKEEINQALSMLTLSQKDLQQEIGGIRQKLKENEILKNRQQERVLAINEQKKESSRWNLLHELIGSADGKKYRNFAQGLTFEMMIGFANRQLQKMNDRYLLIRDAAQPLELNVIDNYQAGEIRSTKNLSGGECFIVSLALSLGLSHMASKNVRVDSLFLDEGFGTLDEEALDTALETLGSLQQNGKLIGIISHVSALKERISTQIQITPQTGGRSIISGPGCGKPRAIIET